MLCSVCKKNTAIVFYNNIDKDGKNTLEGYCYDCAVKKGINPTEVLQSSMISYLKIMDFQKECQNN